MELKKAMNAKAERCAYHGNELRQQHGQRHWQHLPESFGDGIAESGSHGSSGFNSDGRPDDLTQPTRPAHQYQSDRHRIDRHRNDGVAATSGGNGRQCSALLSQWRRRQYPFAFGSRCSGQPTAIRPQYDDAPELPRMPARPGPPSNSSINPVSMGSSSTSNNTSGGK